MDRPLIGHYWTLCGRDCKENECNIVFKKRRRGTEAERRGVTVPPLIDMSVVVIQDYVVVGSWVLRT